jgi:hypothetical protein
MRALISGLMLLVAATTAEAGAWPRPRGETFVSLATRQTTGARTLIAAVQDIDSYTSIYVEHGLTDRLTLGLDAGQGRGPDETVEAGLVFARLPVWSPGPHKVAVELGVGLYEDSIDGTQTRIRPGLSWGRGFESRWGGGWLGMESSWEYRSPSGDTAFKADFTAGLKPTERWMGIMQVQTGAYPDAEPIARLAPSVVRAIGARSHLQAGGLLPIYGDNAYGVTLAMWFTF